MKRIYGRRIVTDNSEIIIWTGGAVYRFKNLPVSRVEALLDELEPWILQWDRNQIRAYRGWYGDQLRIIRERRGLTQAALAQLTGLRQSHISELESGKRYLGKALALRLADCLGVQHYQLL